MKISKPRNKRPKSCHMKNITINKNINRHIPIISSRIFSSKNIPKTPLPQNNKQHIPNSSIYLDCRAFVQWALYNGGFKAKRLFVKRGVFFGNSFRSENDVKICCCCNGHA